MKILTKFIRTLLIYVSALLITASLPLSAMADVAPVDPTVVATTTPDTTSTTTSTPTATAPTTPTTTTSAPASAPTPTYTYDATTGRWNTTSWYYDATTGTYQAVVQPTPPPAVTPTAAVVQPDTTTSTVTPTVITPPPTTSSSAVVGQQNSTATSNSDNQATASNTIGSQAQTGDATVALNTTAANATSGDAASTATILNNVNSTLSAANNQQADSFVTNVMGDVNGDIMLQPMILKTILESGSASPTSTTATVTNTNNLTNNIDLGATSGNAGVVGNTSAGNATSGAANTVANVVNIINSMVTAGQSFVGTINIYGNLNGDILIAPDFIPQLIASNGGSAATGTTTNTSTPTTIISASDMQSIVNNVSLAANSGKAAVMDNTSAGNATTGSANTNVVIFNLTGHDIIASNSLLVFVNVLGKWVGVIVDAPAGATSAVIGNGVTSDTTVTPDLTIVSNNNNQITNNINLASQSGNATVAANTSAGNATSGDATASANIANITNSEFGLSGWFGILFINVFGNWFGSFGINTSAGDPPVVPPTANHVIEFIPSTASQKPSNVTLISQNSDNSFAATSSPVQSGLATVLGSSTSSNPLLTISPASNLSSKSMNVVLLTGSTFIIILSAAGLNRFRIAFKKA